MKDYSQIVSKMTSAPWMITAPALKMILELMDAHMRGAISQEDIRVRLQSTKQDNSDQRSRNHRGIGVLSLSGPIFPKANLMTEMSGATSVEQFRSDFRAMLADDGVSGILLDVDSPGGFSDQIPEMAAEIYAARERKPVYAIANTAANSAAYYLASQAERVYATPSAQVGSIGTYIVHTDETARDEAEGIKNTVIKAGRFKAVEINPLTHEGREYLQGFVDDTNNDFVTAVARGRGITPEQVAQTYGEGGVMTANQAYRVGMIDDIATFDEVVQSMVGGSYTVPLGAAARTAAIKQFGTKQSYDADKEHSEPGTGLGGEPEPREPPEKDDKAIEGGWRRDPPPIAYELEVEEMNRELLVLMATKLGISFNEETTDEDLSKLVADKVDEIVVPLNEATQSAEQQQEFRTLFPDKAAQLDKLLQRDRENEAREFAAGFESFTDNASQGYSGVVRSKIVDCHMKIAERRMTHEDLSDLLLATSAKDSTVTYGEQGSARQTERYQARAGASPQEIRKQFADLVQSAMTEDGIDRKAAIKLVSEQNPELALAYAHS